MLTGCSERKKCERFIKKHPDCFINKTDSIEIKELNFDTIFYTDTLNFNKLDTFILVKDSITVTTILDKEKGIIKQNIKRPKAKYFITTNQPNIKYIYHNMIYKYMFFALLMLFIRLFLYSFSTAQKK